MKPVAHQADKSPDVHPTDGRVRTRWRFSPRMHYLLFIGFTIVTAVPITVLAYWSNRTSFQIELESVRERHLLVAQNLTSTMSRYVRDLKAVFALSFDRGVLAAGIPGLPNLLSSLDVVHVCIVGPDGALEAVLRGLPGRTGPPLTPKLLGELAAVAAKGKSGEPVLSNLYQDSEGLPVLYAVVALPRNRLGIGIVRTNYLVALQKTVAFGQQGHAVITDAKGQVIAHPLSDWVAASRDISGVNVVAAMIRGESGVDQFYSPAFRATMIAGYAVVPESGWGVMVPQPIEELQRRAREVNRMAFIIAIGSFFAAALLSWLIALYLSRPVRQVAATARAVLDGNEEDSVPPFGAGVPSEIRQLGLAFNTMLDSLRRKAAETARALRQAEISNRAKTQFLANMSHEIRTPLNGVVGMTELLRLSDLSPAQQRYVEQATQASQTLLRLIDDILDLSKIEAGKLTLEKAPFYLPALLQDVCTLFAAQAASKGIALAMVLPEPLRMTVIGDQHRLLQILTNLVGNALKFTDRGHIEIRASLAEPAAGAADTAMMVRFEVADTGIGVPFDKQETIFDTFAQADSSMTRRHSGSGLGLSIARQLARMMGGDIGVSSIPGDGALFWFTVALERPPAAMAPAPNKLAAAPVELQPEPPAPATPAAATPATANEPGPRPRIVTSAAGRDFQARLREAGRTELKLLLVEDNTANLRVTQALLETLGCTVVAARNGVEAVAAYRAQPFDLVLMDCQMPEMDGYEATRTIRQIEAWGDKRTPIVALTAHAMEGSREASLESGMDDQLTKPLTLAALTAKLLEWLGTADPSRSRRVDAEANN